MKGGVRWKDVRGGMRCEGRGEEGERREERRRQIKFRLFRSIQTDKNNQNLG